MLSLDFRLVRFALAMLVGLTVTGLPARGRERLPLETFFNSDSVRQVALSPDGNKIAMIAPNKGRYSLALLDTATGKVSVVVHFSDENIRSLFWKGDDHLMFYSAIAGHEVPLLASTDLQGKSVKRILEPRREMEDFSIFFGTLADRFPASDDHILIVGYTSESDPKRINPGMPQSITPFIYKVNVATGRRTQVATTDPEASVSLFDREGQMRLTGAREGKERVFQIRPRNDQPWRAIKSFDLMNVGWSVQTLLADGHTAYLVDTTSVDRGALRTLDLDTGNLGEVLFTPPEGVIRNLILTPGRERLLGVVYEGEKSHTHWIDSRWEKIGRTIQSQFPQHTVTVVSISRDEKRFIFISSSDRDPGSYFLADLRGEGLRVQPITGVRPAIKPDTMSPTEPIKFTARDGLVIHGYLTKPAGIADVHTPMLVLPHGGPFGIRDSWGFSNQVQFLANRGYSVLQVNYRGSGGYGDSFERAGYREWAGKMQDDLTDAVGWVLAQGWAERARVGIMGGSYGGYAALVGVTMTPELYQVGINYAGVSDLRLITRWDLARGAFARAFYEQGVGRDPKVLAERSPIEHVENIRVPTLHAYGRNDPRVEITHWENLERALKKHGKIYEAMVEDAEGHGFEKEDASLVFYHAVEMFLDRYMPVDGLNPKVIVGPLKVVEPSAK